MTQIRRNRRARLASMRIGQLVAVMLLLFIGLVGVAYATIGINWVNWTNTNPGGSPSAINVTPGQSLTIWVNVTTSGDGTADNWGATQFRFSSGGNNYDVCDTGPNYTNDISNQSFQHNITVPNNIPAGTYNLRVRVYNGDACSGGSGTSNATITYNNLVTVQLPSAGVVVNTAQPLWGALNVTFTANTNGDWDSTSYRYSNSDPWICVDTPNHNGSGNYTETFNIAAPIAVANPPATSSHTLQIRTHNGDTCSTSGSNVTSVVYTQSVTIQENNPAIAAACGIDVTLILDESGSIVGTGGDNNISAQVRSGAIALWDVLQDTGSTLSLVEFNTEARRPSAVQNLPITAANKSTFLAYINADGNSTPSSNNYDPEDYSSPNFYTNWEDAFEEAAAINTQYGARDLVLFFTDGVPTTHNPNPASTPPINANSVWPHIPGAAFAANAVKSAGSHVLGIGINNGSDPEDTLPFVSGPEEFTGNNITTADFTMTTGAQFGNALRSLIQELCGSSVTVTKQTWNNAAGEWQEAAGWQYSATASPTGGAFGWEQPSPPAPSTNATISGSTGATGTLTFQWTSANPANPTSITLSETLQNGYEFVSVACLNQQAQPITVTPSLSGNLVNLSSFAVANSAYATCTFRNTEVLLSIVKTAPQNTYPTGAVFDYTITYGNVATADGFASTAYSPVISDPLPDDLKFISGAPQTGPGSCAISGADVNGFGGTVTCTGLPNLAEGATGTIILTVEVQSSDASPGTTVDNEACVDADDSRGTALEQKCDTFTITTPVTVSYFAATQTAGGVRFDWSTSTETDNAGFNIYADTADGIVKLNDELILSTVIDSTSPTDYSVEITGVPDGEYFIEDVSLGGETRLHGAVGPNESFGERVQPEAIDWAAINAENETLERERAARITSAAPLRNDLATHGLSDGSEVQSRTTQPTLDLLVREAGIYRLTYEQIVATGVDLNRTPRGSLAITLQGEPVPVYVSKATFGPGAYIEFVGEDLDTLYTDANVYKLTVDPSLHERIDIRGTLPPRKFNNLPAYYMETVTIERNLRYLYRTPNGDPWYDTLVSVRSTTPAAQKQFDYVINVDNYVAGAAPVSVMMDLWGISERYAGMDHRAVVALNGSQVADELFDGNEIKIITAQAPQSALVNGANTLRLTAPGDTGVDIDQYAVEAYGLTYPRAFVASGGRLDFTAEGRGFSVSGLDSRQVVVYRVTDGHPTLLTGVRLQSGRNGHQATFLGHSESSTYYVSTTDAVLTPQIKVAPPEVDIKSGKADLLIISHPNFINGLGPLVQARQAEGYRVKVVDVSQVYAQYSGGVFDAQAIRDYISHAIERMDVSYVLLVGGDTTDYRNYLGNSSISFIPSLYAATISSITMAPVDPLYTDVDGDRVPDIAIGRFPVRTTAELQLMVNKTLAYGANANAMTGAFAADMGFQRDSDLFASVLETGRSGWQIQRAYISQLGNAGARTALLSHLQQGPRLASFVGHSSAFQWTTNQTGWLFNYNDAAALTNSTPMVITQWGCWNTYYIDPSFSTLGHKFLLSNESGAALVTGSTTVTQASSERKLGERMMPLLAEQGMSVGEAMQTAKENLAQRYPNLTDVLLGWTILGDPTLKVNP